MNVVVVSSVDPVVVVFHFLTASVLLVAPFLLRLHLHLLAPVFLHFVPRWQTYFTQRLMDEFITPYLCTLTI